MRGRASLATTLAVLVGGCAESAADVATFEVTDSAGIRIVTNAPDGGDTLTLGAAPVFRIGDGSAYADTSVLFDVGGGFLTPDGLVLANAGTREMFWFDSAGALRRRTGGRGDGPGEYRFLTMLNARSDGGGVYTIDGNRRRVIAVDGTGEVLWMRMFDPPREEPPPGAWTSFPTALTVLPDGRIVGLGTSVMIADGVAGPMPVVAALRTYDTTSAVLSELGQLTVFVQWENPDAMPPFGTHLEGPMLEYGTRGRRLAYATEGVPRIEVLDDGARTLSIRERRARHAFVPDSIPAGGGAADSLPAYRDVHVDALDRVWAQVADPDPDRPDEWRVFATDGTALGTLSLPPDATVLDADATRVLLLRRDSLGVETVELWGVSWSERGSP